MVESKREEECFRLLTLVLQCLEEWGETAIGGCLEFGWIFDMEVRSLNREVSGDELAKLLRVAERPSDFGLPWVISVVTFIASGVPTRYIPGCRGWRRRCRRAEVRIQGSLAAAILRKGNDQQVCSVHSLCCDQAYELLGLVKKVQAEAVYVFPVGDGAKLHFNGSKWLIETPCELTELLLLALLE